MRSVALRCDAVSFAFAFAVCVELLFMFELMCYSCVVLWCCCCVVGVCCCLSVSLACVVLFVVLTCLMLLHGVWL